MDVDGLRGANEKNEFLNKGSLVFKSKKHNSYQNLQLLYLIR